MKKLRFQKLCYFYGALLVTVSLSLVNMKAFAETLRLSTPVPPSHIFSKVSSKFSEDLNARTNGALNIKVFPFGKLGADPENTLMIQTGAIQFAVIPAAFLANREESLNAWFLPGLFDNVQDAGLAAKLPAAADMLEVLDQQGMVGLGYVFAGMRHLISTKSISNLDELRDKKVRAFPGPIFNDWWLTFGAAPTALPLPEISPALSTNLIDIVDVDLDLVTALKLYQQAPYLIKTNHMAFPGVMVASKKWWNTKTAEQKQLILEVFSEAESWGVMEQVKAEERNLKTLNEAGVNITSIDKNSYKENAEEIVTKYLEKDELIASFYSQIGSNK